MYAWFSLTSSSSEDTYDRVQAWSCLELERAKAHAAACSALFVSFLAYGHSHLHWKLGSERHRACWPSLPQPCSAADRPGLLWHPIRSAWAEFLSVSPTGPPLRIWLQAYHSPFLLQGPLVEKPVLQPRYQLLWTHSPCCSYCLTTSQAPPLAGCFLNPSISLFLQRNARICSRFSEVSC